MACQSRNQPHLFLADKPQHTIESRGAVRSDKDHCVVGLQTKHNGTVQFRGRYHTFIIQFKINGFNKIFRIAANEFKDKIVSLAAVFGRKADDLYNELLNAEDIQQMALFADRFLLTFLRLNKDRFTGKDSITSIASFLCRATHLLRITQCDYNANMSVQNFERRFAEQIGVLPKQYTKLFRFNEALKVKLKAPKKCWTAIAHECGYFDQMHLIKDFKQYTGLAPIELFNNIQSGDVPTVEFISVTRAIT